MGLCQWGAGLAHVGEDFIDDVRIGDICDDSQVAAAQLVSVIGQPPMISGATLHQSRNIRVLL